MYGTIEVALGLLLAVAALAALARRLEVPYPILLVLGGLALGFVPGLPEIGLDPDLVFLLFLPPLVYYEALFASPRDLRANLRPILLLTLGLVAITTCAVAVVAHALVEGLSWPAAFVLGAIVSPTDSVSASAIAQRLGVPRRVVTVLEGEGLANDALVIAGFRIAIGPLVAGTLSLPAVALDLLVGTLGGAAVGLVLGWAQVWLLGRLGDPVVANVVFLAFPFASYLAAYELGLSGIVAVLVSALYVGWHAPRIVPGRTRLQGQAFWEVLLFLVNGFVFVLVGLQLGGILDRLSGYFAAADLALYAALVSFTVVVARLLWVFPATYVPRLLSRSLRERDPPPGPRTVAVLAWSGMRGAISLAVALSVPLSTGAGASFEAERDLIVFLTFSVILATLVVQGLSLPAVIQVLGVEDDGAEEREEAEGRLAAAQAALARLDELSGEDWVRADTAERLRAFYDYRRRRFAARLAPILKEDRPPAGEDYEARSAAYGRLLGELFRAQREALVRLRDEGRLDGEALQRVERDLDLEESRLEI